MAKRTTKRKPAAKSAISRMIRDAFKESGLSKYRVATDLKLSEPTVGRILNGDVDPGSEIAEKMLAYFGFTIVPPTKRGTKQ